MKMEKYTTSDPGGLARVVSKITLQLVQLDPSFSLEMHPC